MHPSKLVFYCPYLRKVKFVSNMHFWSNRNWNWNLATTNPGPEKWSGGEDSEHSVGREGVWEVVTGKWQGHHGHPGPQRAGPDLGQGRPSSIITRGQLKCMWVSTPKLCVFTGCVWPDDAAKLFFVLLGLITGNKLCRVILGVKGFWIGFCFLVINSYSVTIFCAVVDLFIILRCICVICLKNLWLLL